MADATDFIFSVDLDGVVFDYEQAMRDYVAFERGLDPATLPPLTSWSLVASGWPFADEDDFLATHARAVADGGLFVRMPAFAGVSQALWRLSDAEVHIRIVTARLATNGTHAVAVADTVRALDVHKIPYRELLFTAHKDQALSGPAAADPQRLLHIDDSPKQLQTLQDAGVPTIVMDQAYNRHIPGPRAHNWAEVEQIVASKAGITLAA